LQEIDDKTLRHDTAKRNSEDEDGWMDLSEMPVHLLGFRCQGEGGRAGEGG